MIQLPYNQEQWEAIQQLVHDKYYIGEVSQNGFIIKRNFGIRRLTLYGEIKSDKILIQVRNELLHQVSLIMGYVFLGILIVLTLYQESFTISIILCIIALLMYLDNRYRIQKEYKYFLERLK